jgi:hypothetical protein
LWLDKVAELGRTCADMPPASTLLRGYQARIAELLTDPAATVDLTKSATDDTAAPAGDTPLPVPHRPLSPAELRQLDLMPDDVRRTLTPDELGERLRHAVALDAMADGLPPVDAAPIHQARHAVLRRAGARSAQ